MGMQRFVIGRTAEGTREGVLAEGVQFSSQSETEQERICVLHWLTHASTGQYPSIAAIEQIHCYNGTATIQWLDLEPSEQPTRPALRIQESGLSYEETCALAQALVQEQIASQPTSPLLEAVQTDAMQFSQLVMELHTSYERLLQEADMLLTRDSIYEFVGSTPIGRQGVQEHGTVEREVANYEHA